MKLLAISEHYFPRVGGTVNYLHETLSALVRQGVDAELWVPGPAPENWLPENVDAPAYRVRWVDAGYPSEGDPGREQRYLFCKRVNDEAHAAARSPDAPNLVHVMFGLFVMEVLDTAGLSVPTVATVHNVPPMECALLPPEAPALARLKELARLQAVSWKNNGRLRRHHYDQYIVPSRQVASLLSGVLPRAPVQVVPHGPTGELLNLMSPPAKRQPEPGAPLRLLTVGGFAPHKRQHLIPEVADRLKAGGHRVEWDVVGPAGRIAGYFSSIETDIQRRGLGSNVRLHRALPFGELAKFYDRANLYVQPSTEEGFCITALDAAAAGLPVVASPAGALPEIAAAGGGLLVESAIAPLTDAIGRFVAEERWHKAAGRSEQIRDTYSWKSAAATLLERYHALTKVTRRVDA
ncbi:glycosyltransferase family 4 protein [Pseudoruegeria sp. HB172150]|uniref:glycosyltransferase family 4 protein n=1 Tax=Pseudoruegeria sp. HB172150 TaxID=2721164 RepID=UPI0015556562|nr:glycosyltransferase family 4 protein [Pseudoruegeria sp. HB172150]